MSCMGTCECFSVSKFWVFFRIFYIDKYGEYDQQIFSRLYWVSNSYKSYFIKDWSKSILLIKELLVIVKY